MNYNRFSKAWQNELKPYLRAKQRRTWERIVEMYGFDKESIVESSQLTVLSEGVWVEIVDIAEFRKFRGITSSNIYYDGDFANIYSTSYVSHRHKFRIDNQEIDLRSSMPSVETKVKLLEFIKKATGITDEVLPEVPKGILKI